MTFLLESGILGGLPLGNYTGRNSTSTVSDPMGGRGSALVTGAASGPFWWRRAQTIIRCAARSLQAWRSPIFKHKRANLTTP